MRIHSQRRNKRDLAVPHRSGSVLVVALVCLLLVMTMLGLMLQGSLRAKRQLHRERDRRQTECLLQSGLERAAYRLSHEPAYRGETWSLSSDSITGSGDGRVVIRLSRASDDEPWQVDVAAEYPLGTDRSICRSRTFLIQPQLSRTQE